MHIVPEGRHAQGWFVQIRNYQKSDLCAEDKAAPLHVVKI